MTLLQAILRYLCQQYPHKAELSKARLTKMVYLADWEYARQWRRQITDITWQFDHFGPYVSDVVQAAESDVYLRLEQTTNMYGSPKTLIQYVGPPMLPQMPADVKQILDDVIAETAPLTFRPFIQHVYGTYPIRTADRYTALDLVHAAEVERACG